MGTVFVRPQRARHLFVVLALSTTVAASACNGPAPAPVVDAAAREPSAPASASAASMEMTEGDQVTPPPTGGGKKGPKPPASLPPAKITKGAIQVEVKSVQLFHPYAANAYLPSLKDDGFDNRGYGAKGTFEWGVVIEAVNTTNDLFEAPVLKGELTFTGEAGIMTCPAETTTTGYHGTSFVSFYPAKPAAQKPKVSAEEAELFGIGGGGGADTRWRVDATNDDEKFWRPGERIRMTARSKGCLLPVLLDLGVTGIRATLGMVASRHFSSLRVASEPTVIDIDAHAVSLQVVKLAQDEIAHTSGNIVIRAKEGVVTFDDMAKLGLSIERLERQPLPDAMPPIAIASDELRASVVGTTLVHFTDDPALERGQRRLDVKWKIDVAAGDIAGRLQKAVDDAQGAAKAAAERAQKAGPDAERARLAKVLTCGAIRLVTNKSPARDPSKGGDATKACAAIEKSDSVEVTISYVLERYELPVGLAYSVSGAKKFSPIANATLLKLDPR